MFDCLHDSSLFLHLHSCTWSLIHGAVNEATACNFLNVLWEGIGYTPLCRGSEGWSTVQTLVLFVIAESQIDSGVLSSLCISAWETLGYLQLASRSCSNLGLRSNFITKLAYWNSVSIRSKYTSTQTLRSLVSCRQNGKKVWNNSYKQAYWRSLLRLPLWASLHLEVAASGLSQYLFAP